MINTAYDGWLGARHSRIPLFRLLLCSVPTILVYVNKPKALVTSEDYHNKHSVTLVSRVGESGVIHVWIVTVRWGCEVVRSMRPIP
jgi:hypothetical protein